MEVWINLFKVKFEFLWVSIVKEFLCIIMGLVVKFNKRFICSSLDDMLVFDVLRFEVFLVISRICLNCNSIIKELWCLL